MQTPRWLSGALRPPTVFVLLTLFCVGPARADDPAAAPDTAATASLRLARFDLDATPPLGTMMAYDRVVRHDELGLRCRGIVLLGAEQPIVLCAIDWIGVSNESQDVFKRLLAEAAGTTPERVAVHALHQHDAPRCDFGAEQVLHEAGISDLGPHDASFARAWLKKLKPAVAASLEKTVPITHAGIGVAEVEQVASNRRILNDQGVVRAVRYTTCTDPELRAEPEGVVDPELSALSFWNDDQPVAVLTYYATHPQSYYRTGVPSSDFPGIARFLRGQELPAALHVHFNGAGGNIGAGKYNDGSKANRVLLAGRVAAAMKQAFENTDRFPLSADAVDWSTEGVALPPGKHLDADALRHQLSGPARTDIIRASSRLAYLRRYERGEKIVLQCLRVGDVRILHLPGELFVEYQLAAKAMRPDLHVAMAAYGDYGTAYIGTAEAYSQGGYETSPSATCVDQRSEPILMDAMAKLLEVDPAAQTEAPTATKTKSKTAAAANNTETAE